MTARFQGSAQRRARELSARFDRLGRAPLTWLIMAGLVSMMAIAIGTGLALERFKQDAIENGREGLESAVLLLVRHFDRQFEDFSVLQKSIVAELESHTFNSPDVFRSEMATLAVHEVLRAKASGLTDVAGANVFDSNGVLINSSQRWPVADVRISDRAYFNKLKSDPELLEEVEVVSGRFSPTKAIVFARRIWARMANSSAWSRARSRPTSWKPFSLPRALGIRPRWPCTIATASYWRGSHMPTP